MKYNFCSWCGAPIFSDGLESHCACESGPMQFDCDTGVKFTKVSDPLRILPADEPTPFDDLSLIPLTDHELRAMNDAFRFWRIPLVPEDPMMVLWNKQQREKCFVRDGRHLMNHEAE